MYILIEYFNGIATTHYGPFNTPDKAYDWQDKLKVIPPNELGIDRYVRECKTYDVVRLLTVTR